LSINIFLNGLQITLSLSVKIIKKSKQTKRHNQKEGSIFAKFQLY